MEPCRGTCCKKAPTRVQYLIVGMTNKMNVPARAFQASGFSQLRNAPSEKWAVSSAWLEHLTFKIRKRSGGREFESRTARPFQWCRDAAAHRINAVCTDRREVLF